MWVPLIVGAALLFKQNAQPPAPPAPPPAPKPNGDAVPAEVAYYLTNKSLLLANDRVQGGMSVDEASRLAASEVVDDYMAGK